MIGSRGKDLWELESRAAGLPESLHAALHGAYSVTQSWPKQGAPAHSWPAVPGQWSESKPDSSAHRIYQDLGNINVI